MMCSVEAGSSSVLVRNGDEPGLGDRARAFWWEVDRGERGFDMAIANLCKGKAKSWSLEDVM